MHLPLRFISGHPSDILPDDVQIERGLLETMRGNRRGVPLWPYHRARLMRSHQVSNAVLDDISHFLTRVSRFADGDLRLRLRIGFFCGEPHWDLQIEPLVTPPGLDDGVTLQLCETRLLCRETANPGCKELARSRYNRAMAELPRRDLLHDGLMLDERGRLVETLRCNLLLWLGDGWVTPDLTNCGVRGVMRDWLSERVPIREAALDRADLGSAEEVAVCNSVRGVLPVRALDCMHKWAAGRQTAYLQNLVVEQLW
ncbi:aminotransferase class IV [Microbulbifer guangxiensis]|uniref:aminotransferase class IV n=1 Tax=Microbulbifer guangxiensis TaxID=2904249 RepID=UPI001F181585|nr:aminotransferase class IV [Microbulbifer guangxiensis]